VAAMGTGRLGAAAAAGDDKESKMDAQETRGEAAAAAGDDKESKMGAQETRGEAAAAWGNGDAQEDTDAAREAAARAAASLAAARASNMLQFWEKILPKVEETNLGKTQKKELKQVLTTYKKLKNKKSSGYFTENYTPPRRTTLDEKIRELKERREAIEQKIAYLNEGKLVNERFKVEFDKTKTTTKVAENGSKVTHTSSVDGTITWPEQDKVVKAAEIDVKDRLDDLLKVTLSQTEKNKMRPHPQLMEKIVRHMLQANDRNEVNHRLMILLEYLEEYQHTREHPDKHPESAVFSHMHLGFVSATPVIVFSHKTRMIPIAVLK